MDPILLVFACLALASFSLLCVIATIMVFRLRKNVDSITHSATSVASDVKALRVQTEPLLESATSALQKMGSSMEQLDVALNHLSDGSKVVSSMAHDVRDLERRILSQLEPPVQDVLAILASSTKGIIAFLRRLSGS